MNAKRIGSIRRRLPFTDGVTGRREWFILVGGAGVVVFSLVALFAPMLAPYAADARVGQPLQSPGGDHLLGTDDMGHDLLSLLIIGARVSLLVGLFAGSLAILVGMVVGVTAGVVGGRVETVLMRVVDIVLTLPFLPLVIVAAAILGPGLWTTIGVITLVMWARPARELRSQVVSVRQREYVKASRSMGASFYHVARRYVVPAVLPIAVAQFAKAVGAAILLEASLGFLGLGDPTVPSWGTILFFAQKRSAFLTDAWTWWVLPPGVAITSSVLSFTFLALGAERRAGDGRTNVVTGGSDTDVEIVPSDPECPQAPTLGVTGLTVAYGTASEHPAVDGVSLTLRRNETVALVGESGSGKSSLALSLLGLLRPPGRVTSGVVTLHADSGAGGDLSDIRGDEIAFVPQEAMNALDPRVPLDEQVVEAILTHRTCTRDEALETAHDVLGTVGLDSEIYGRYPHELSGGMRQRGVIATALVNDPSVLVVDEATTGLDVVTKLTVLDLLEELRMERGFSLLMVSHDLAAVSHVADRLAVMRDGEFVETGEPARLRSSPNHPYTRELFGACPRISTANADPSTDDEAPSKSTARNELLVYDGIYKTFGDSKPVLSGVRLAVGRGESVALIGESGVGKSTLGRMTVGLDIPDEGCVRIDGETVREKLARGRRRLGRDVHYLFQDPYESVPPNRSVAEIVREPLDIHEHVDERERPERAHDALEAVELTPAVEYAARYPSQLSGGERQRVALARALVLEPSVLVADEPTSMLDAPLQEDLLTLLYDSVADRGITLLHITHNVAQVSSFADRIAVLHDGHIVEEAPPENILRNPSHPATRTLVEAAVELSGDGAAGECHETDSDERHATTFDEP